MPETEPRTLGDYRLIEPLAEHAGQTTWLAEQSSVQRPVVLVELTNLKYRETFLADVRAKASVDHPLIGSVYEAVDEPHACYVALERITGNSLGDRLRSREAMRPSDLAHILRRTAEAMIQLASKGTATEPLTPDTIHFDSNGVIRIENVARAGDFDPKGQIDDVHRLGEMLPPLVADGLPGASRVLTVLAWMRGHGTEKQIDWEAVRSYGEQIESQLLEARPPAVTSPRTARVPLKKSKLPMILGGLVAVVGIGTVAMVMFPKGDPPPPEVLPTLPVPVPIAAGSHPSPDGGTEKLPAFEISACEVTIGEYREFLDVLEQLDPGERDVFDLEDQPEEKKGHVPDGWEEMLAAARSGGTWNDRPMSLFCPVVGVDWWDASAYCNWKNCRLPTQEEWFAALRSKVERPEYLQPAPWGPVTDLSINDRTPNGLRGMAGSVSEWTRRPSVNPANPLGPRHIVIIGASFKKPDNGALAREWTPNRLLRRSDLGFRVVTRPD
ncbi:methyltransferase [Haloferula helveola]|uniref:Methyltransferase n=1 Tax=Haloferula helveola TaxID=490095 RepID=A0ABN6H2A8_9BACT|nr:methyltransferase [Haloferula helveola]